MSVHPENRVVCPLIADERIMLESWLDYQRSTLHMKCAGLEHDQLRVRAVEPSSLSLLGLVRHMAEVERGWFRRVLAAEDAPPLYYTETDRDGDFDNVDAADADEAFSTWAAECARARTLVKARSFDDVVIRPQSGESISLRWIMVHMIEEYARHNGHADFLRERLDGSTGD